MVMGIRKLMERVLFRCSNACLSTMTNGGFLESKQNFDVQLTREDQNVKNKSQPDVVKD